VDQFAPGLFGRVAALLAVMVPFARAELEQIGRKMACNEYFGASPALSHSRLRHSHSLVKV